MLAAPPGVAQVGGTLLAGYYVCQGISAIAVVWLTVVLGRRARPQRVWLQLGCLGLQSGWGQDQRGIQRAWVNK